MNKDLLDTLYATANNEVGGVQVRTTILKWAARAEIQRRLAYSLHTRRGPYGDWQADVWITVADHNGPPRPIASSDGHYTEAHALVWAENMRNAYARGESRAVPK